VSTVTTASPAVVRVFRVAAVAEACSWIGLLIGMAVKYLGSGSEAGVHVFGPIHGGLFVVYVLATLACARSRRWSPLVALAALAASIPPLATIVFERWATRTGRLG
jgi:integral membrane protein